MLHLRTSWQRREGRFVAGYARCRQSKNREQEGAGNGMFAPEGARSVVGYISRL